MSDYNIEKIGPERFDILVPLMKDCFGMDVNINYFEWKYTANPAGDFIGFIAVQKDTGEIGAYYGVIPQKFFIEGKEKTIYQSCDTMTHSKHRRKGLFQKLALECYSYLRAQNNLFVIGFGGAQSTPGFIKFGWKHVFNFKYYFKPYPVCLLSVFRSYKKECFTEDDFSGIENFCNSLPYPAAIHSNRNVMHIKWRTQNPNYQYKLISFRSKDTVEGYLIYYIQQNKIILFDFKFSTAQSRKALFWYIAQKTVSNKFKGIVAFCQEDGINAGYLKAGGYWANPFKKGPLSEKTPFIFYADEENLHKYANSKSWEVTAYDHDAL